MKVLDLRCSSDHRFEGWFGSEADYLLQTARGLVDCPLCGDRSISRLPSAPRLNVFKAKERGGEARHSSGAETRLPIDSGSRNADRELTVASSSSVAPPAGLPDANASGAMTVSDMQAGWMHAIRRVMANTEDVGPRFAEEARRIHHGESEERAIRGQATREDAEALREEGIEVVAMLVPDALKGSLQ